MRPQSVALRDAAARNAIALANVGLIWKVILHGSFRVPYQDRDDAFQHAFMAVMRAAELWDGSTKFSTYATMAISNALQRWTIANHLIPLPPHAFRKTHPMREANRQKAHNARRRFAAVKEEVLSIDDMDREPWISEADIRRVIDELPGCERDRRILGMRLLDNCPWDEIAAAVGYGLETLRNRFFRARRQLRKALCSLT